jgi:hypothetical protein
LFRLVSAVLDELTEIMSRDCQDHGIS